MHCCNLKLCTLPQPWSRFIYVYHVMNALNTEVECNILKSIIKFKRNTFDICCLSKSSPLVTSNLITCITLCKVCKGSHFFQVILSWKHRGKLFMMNIVKPLTGKLIHTDPRIDTQASHLVDTDSFSYNRDKGHRPREYDL